MQGSGVAWPELLVIRGPADAFVVVHLERFERSDVRVAVQFHVGPERRSEEPESAEVDGFVFEDVDVSAGGFGADFFEETGEFVAVVLVIAGEIDDGGVRELVADPADAVQFEVDVTGEDDEVGGGWGKVDGTEFEMQIAEDVDAHGVSAGGNLSGGAGGWEGGIPVMGDPGCYQKNKRGWDSPARMRWISRLARLARQCFASGQMV